MKRTIISISLLLLAAFTAPLFAQVGGAPSAADFIPVVNGGPEEVAKPDKVKVDETNKVVEAATIQDAANAAAEMSEEELSESTMLIKAGSGWGVISTGVAFYSGDMPNPNARRTAIRNAHIFAYMHAKKGMSEFLNPTKIESNSVLREMVSGGDTATVSRTEDSTEYKENIKNVCDGLLRGFVVYKWKDNPEKKCVSVTIIATPKTMGQFKQTDPTTISADSLQEGINQVLMEVRGGLVPLIGGRTIYVRTTGELAFVGFGSALIREVPANLKNKTQLNALRVAQMRAKSSLCSIICGEQVTSAELGDGGSKESIVSVEEFTKNDPNQKDGSDEATAKIQESRSEFQSNEKNETIIQGATKGMLPPGVNVKRWRDGQNEWAFAMAVYLPSSTYQANEIRKTMQNIQPYDRGDSSAGSTGSEASAEQNGSTRKVKSTDTHYEGGTIMDVEDL